MRHRINGKQLSRDSEHRRAMLKNMAAGLFEHGEIETTLPKAKAVQPLVEKIITIAKKGGLHARREIESKLNDRKIHSWVADPNMPESKKDNPYFDLPNASDIEFNRYGELRKAPRLVQHVMTNIAPLFEDRDGGYTRIVKLGKHRLGDGTDLVLLQLVGREDGPEIGGGTSRRREKMNNRAAFAAKLRKGGDGAVATEEPPAAEAPADVSDDAPVPVEDAADEKSDD
ncbi:MAG: 50S ribosomal protein L17 [Planctomycetota bacterium]